MMKERFKEVEVWLATENLAAEVHAPPDNTPLIRGLQYIDGWLYSMPDYTKRTSSLERIQRHASDVHKVASRHAQRKANIYRRNPLADEASTLPSHGPTPEPQRRDAPGPTAM
ncbi:hypothetical protein A1O3_10468 [Capronia epimyces CBS 606.96]|uniref:Uncharacterized protein n=1 Tax=Capronia epimyces CBS 606.96 TaxID=1182542 RepID=W9XIY2_9EURO|nr:uncharacterized protein A1O3_10468 [Capronia epimyces CBS 606.96]EXJ77310.1 hypothetical protein A1O3_10468 [Capronia epimyces CBS 606.96]